MDRTAPDNAHLVDDEVLREVARHGAVEVVRSGEVVAVLVGPEAARRPTVRPASIAGGFSRLRRARVSRSTQEILDDLRADR